MSQAKRGSGRGRWGRTSQAGGYPAGSEESQSKSETESTPAIRSVCVIGGGPSGLACCRGLLEGGVQNVTLIQESRGLGGKLCTKFVNGKEDPTLHFDMGVQLLRPEGPLAEALSSAEIVQPWPEAGRFKRLRQKHSEDVNTCGLVVGVPSMSAIGRYLANQCGPGLEIHVDRTAHVRGWHRGSWLVEWSRGEATKQQLGYRPELSEKKEDLSGHGSFDAVVLAYEANKVLRGCKSGYKMTQPSATPAIRHALGNVRTGQMWNLMVAFDDPLKAELPFDAAYVEGHPAIAWVANNSSKPGRCATPECWMVFSTREWADSWHWQKREVEKDLCAEFLGFLEQHLGRKPPRPSFVLAGRWGNNTERCIGEKRIAHEEFPERCLKGGTQGTELHPVWDAAEQFGAVGDWAGGHAVGDAYASGLALASSIAGDSQFSSPGRRSKAARRVEMASDTVMGA